MKVILKPVFNFITGQVDVFENPVWDYLLMTAILAIAFAGAFAIVGALYDADVISGSDTGSILHWIFRILIFLVLVYIARAIIAFCIAIAAIPTWVWIIIAIVGTISVSTILKKIF